jgi:hypothetical protein
MMAAQNVKDMPLRAVTGFFLDDDAVRYERFECGHSAPQRYTGLGYRTTAQRRRCWKCLRCQECGKAIYAHERMTRNDDGFWHADCANAPR